MDAMDLGETLRARRISLKLTQDDLARAAGVSKRTISTLESQSYNTPTTMNVLMRVTDALGLELSVKERKVPTLDDLLRDQAKQAQSKPLDTSRRRVRSRMRHR